MACYNSCVLNAPIDDVWDIIKDFYDLSWGDTSGIESLEVIGNKTGTEVGACRLVNGAISETLLEFDENDYGFIYCIDYGPGILSKETLHDYQGAIQLSPITLDGGTFMEWSATWNSDSPGVQEMLDPIFRSFMVKLVDKFS